MKIVNFLPTLLKRDALSERGAHASFHLMVTASGLVKRAGSDPPALAGRNLTYEHGYSGFLFCFISSVRLRRFIWNKAPSAHACGGQRR